MARRGHPMSAATRAKISAALKGRHHAGHPGTHHRGHPMSAATRAKISAALRGKHHPHRGHPMSAQTRAKISAALRGKPHPHRGHAMSAATRSKISAALRARHGGHAAVKRAAHHPAAHHPRKAAGRQSVKATTTRHAAVAEHHLPGGKHPHLSVIGTPQKVRHHARHRPALISTGKGYHRRTLTHLHRHRSRVHRLRIRRMTTNHRVKPRRRA